MHVFHKYPSVSSIAALGLAFISRQACAHGPVVVLSNMNGQIVTNQLDVTPQPPAANSSYPVGSAARVFPSQYNLADYNSFSSTSYASNQPQNMGAIPMSWVTVGSSSAPDSALDSGYYGQLEPTDAVGNSTIATGPGYAYGSGGFAANTVLQIVFGSTLQYWNSATSSFGATPDGEQIQAIRGSSFTPGTQFANTLTSNSAQTGTGLLVNVGSNNNNAGAHSQLMYRILDGSGHSVEGTSTNETLPTESQIADGLYLATFQIGTAANTASGTSLTASLPYYFLFELNRDGDVTQEQVNAAVANIDTIAGVPEPTAVVMVALVGGLLGRRRFRASSRN